MHLSFTAPFLVGGALLSALAGASPNPKNPSNLLPDVLLESLAANRGHSSSSLVQRGIGLPKSKDSPEDEFKAYKQRDIGYLNAYLLDALRVDASVDKSGKYSTLQENCLKVIILQHPNIAEIFNVSADLQVSGNRLWCYFNKGGTVECSEDYQNNRRFFVWDELSWRIGGRANDTPRTFIWKTVFETPYDASLKPLTFDPKGDFELRLYRLTA